jgi:predicted nucleic acid-binding protein
MFLLDTNVLSAIMAVDPPPAVAAWVSQQDIELLFTTAISRAEILAGLAVMAKGRRRSTLERAARDMFQEDFFERVPPFDVAAADAYAELFAARKRAGRPPATIDLMIAAIASSHGASVVTRNVADFDGCGVAIVNPWVD